MTWQLANPLMLLGLLGVAIPIVIHLLNRRRAQVVDWGAMQFLEIGRSARRRVQLADLLLMAGRMLMLGLVALALARPFWTPHAAGGEAVSPSAAGGRRDVVIILDGSASMGRKGGGSDPRERAVAWAGDFVGRLAPGSSVSVLLAGDRVRPLVDALSFDGVKVREALEQAPTPRGSSDLPAAIAEALRRLEAGQNPARDVVILTDGQRLPWRPGEPRRWALLRELHREFARRRGVTPGLWALDFGRGAGSEGADGSVGPIEIARGLVPPLLPLEVRATVANAGPGPLTRTAELLIDGRPVPGSARVVGPVPPGGRVPLALRATLAEPGSHALTVRLAPADDDPLAANDEASRPVEVVPALPVLLVDGEPGREPLSGETDFVRAALAPTGDDTPQVAATVVEAADLAADDLEGQKVLVLANVDRLTPEQAALVSAFVGEGGGLLIAPGDRTAAGSFNESGGAGWMPASLGPARGEPSRREAVARPAPATFSGPSLAPFGQGEAPALGEAELFSYRVLSGSPGASVLARLDTGDPWIVERPYRSGRAIAIAGALDAEGGTLPVNPDFVPFLHELVYHLADHDASASAVRPGEPLAVELDGDAGGEAVVTTPSGETLPAAIARESGRTRAVLARADEPGLYRFATPGGVAYAAVAGDPRESSVEPLTPAEERRLSDGWPLAFEGRPGRLADRLFASGQGGPRPIWRALVLAALAGLCLEVLLTRRMARSRGIATFADGE